MVLCQNVVQKAKDWWALISSAPSFGFSVSKFIYFYSLVAWNPGYVYVGIVVSL